MTDKELEKLLKGKCKAFDLKQIAFNRLQQIISDTPNDKDALSGYTQDEIKTIFQRFEYHVDRRIGGVTAIRK